MQTKNLPIIIGIALPILFIVIISAVVFVPSLFVKPQHNFIYTQENSYNYYNQGYKNTYKIENEHITLQQMPVREKETYVGDMPTIYLYDVKLNTSHEISLDEAKNLSLNAGPSSPDGYAINYKRSNEGLFGLFGSNSNGNGYYVTKGKGGKKLDALVNNGYNSYNGSFKLIGWIK